MTAAHGSPIGRSAALIVLGLGLASCSTVSSSDDALDSLDRLPRPASTSAAPATTASPATTVSPGRGRLRRRGTGDGQFAARTTATSG